MFDIPKTATGLHRFAAVHQEALQNAALVQGGRRWLRMAQDLLEDLRLGGPIDRRIHCKTLALLELLALTVGRETLPPEGNDREICDPVAIQAEEIKMLMSAFADALSELKANGGSGSAVELEGGKND